MKIATWNVLCGLLAISSVAMGQEPTDADADSTSTTEQQTEAPKEMSPAVAIIVESNPSTPADLLRAVDLLVKLDRTDLAAPMLEKLVGMNLDPNSLVALHGKFGSGPFVQLSRNRELHPHAQQLASATLKAVDAHRKDEDRIAALVEQIYSDDQRAARRARRKLIQAQQYAVPALIGSVADRSPEQQARAVSAVIRIGDVAVAPLVCYLKSESLQVRHAAINALGRIGSPDVLAYLCHPFLADGADKLEAERAFVRATNRKPSREEAFVLLRAAANRRYEQTRASRPGNHEQTEFWFWHLTEQRAVPTMLPEVDALSVEASRWYKDLHELSSENVEFEVRAIATSLESEKAIGGLDRPLRRGPETAFDFAMSGGTDVVEKVLASAMKDQHPIAAMAACEVLSDIASANVLKSSDGQPRPLSKALTHVDPRVRFAAAMAIAKYRPDKSFAGASHLPEALGYVAASTGQRRVLIVHPRLDIARDISGMLQQYGFSGDVVSKGDEFLRRATMTSDYEFFLVSDAMNRPEAGQLIQQARRNPLSASVPIGILTRQITQERSELQASLSLNMIAIPEPTTPEDVRSHIPELLRISSRFGIDAGRRLEMALQALDALVDLAEHDASMELDLTRQFPRVESTLYSAELGNKAAAFIGNLGSRRAQLALIEVVNQQRLPSARRRSAGEAFENSVSRFGVLMNPNEISQQYEIYNGSADQDETTQAILGAVLDTIENRLGVTKR